jgi:hypothetical protein
MAVPQQPRDGYTRRVYYMSDLLVPGDERELTAFLCETLGAKLLLSDVTTAGEPHVASDALAALPRTLPGPAFFGDTSVRALLFWLPSVGPIRTMVDARPPETPHDRVAQLLSRQAAGERAPDLIDLERTPVLTLNRSTALGPNRLAPGGLGSMPIRTAALPAEVRAVSSKARRWLRARAVKADPFDYCAEVRSRRPRSLGPLWCWVQPEAWRLVEAGAEIWPWNA